MEPPHLSPRLFLRNFTTTSISTTLSASSSPTVQSTSTATSPTSHSTALTTSSPTSHFISTTSSLTTDSTSLTSSSTFLSTSTIFSPTTLSTSTSTSTSTLIPTHSPTPKPTQPPSPPTHHTAPIPLYVGIALSLLGLALLIFLLLRLEPYLRQRRQRSKLVSSIPLTPHSGLRTLHLPQLLQNRRGNNKHKHKHNRRSRIEFQDGRRFGVVGLGLDEIAEGDGVQSEEMGRRNRERFEKWKRERGFGSLKGEEIREEESVEEIGYRGRRERRETFDAWKRGVVPPGKGEEPIGVQTKSSGSEIGLGTRALGNVGLSFIPKAGEEEEVPRNVDDYDTRKQKQVADDDTPTSSQGPLN